MTEKQKLELREAEIRVKLNEYAGLAGDDLTDEIRAEIPVLTAEYADLGVRMQAAIVAEDDERRHVQLRAGDDDPETAELRSLIGRAQLGAYLTAFADQAAPSGAEKELLEARDLSLAGNIVPWDALLPPAPPAAELRADAVTPAPGSGDPTNQSTIIGRVFARSATALLGVSMPAVGTGQASFPVITDGQDPEFVAPDGVKEAAAGSIVSNVLTAQRLQARFRFRLEDEATTAGLETALRMDLSAALSDTLDRQIIGAGNARVRGFLAAEADGGLPDKAAPASVVTFTTAVAEAAGAVDGIYAGDEGEIVWIQGVKSYSKLASLFVETMSATDHLRAKLRALRASANIPAVANDSQMGIISKTGSGGMNAVAPIWNSIRLLRDEATAATSGAINVTAVMLANFRILRAAAYQRTHLKLA